MTQTIEQALDHNGFLIRPVEGDSMMPLLDQTSDTVKIVPITKPLKKYDIPLYRRPSGQLVLHRIIKVKRNGFITCGDNRYRKEYVPKQLIIAVAEGIYKGSEYISLDTEEMLKYAKKVILKRPLKVLRSIPKKVANKIKRFLKK